MLTKKKVNNFEAYSDTYIYIIGLRRQNNVALIYFIFLSVLYGERRKTNEAYSDICIYIYIIGLRRQNNVALIYLFFFYLFYMENGERQIT